MRYHILFSTLVMLLLSNLNSHFNYSYCPHLAIVNEINSPYLELDGKDNHLHHTAKTDFQLRTVVIDPGHGGHDHGCSGNHSKEKYISLKIAKKLGNYIKNKFPRVKVIYTRERDVFVPLYTRAAIANRNNADLFISIHCNAITHHKQSVRGTETYIMGAHDTEENLDVAKRENEAILLEKDYEKNYHGFDPQSPEGHIILSMVQNAFLEQSISFAQKVENNFEQIAGRKSRGVKQAGFLVLRETAMPSVLIESGYLTNLKEEKFMKSDKGQDDLAFAIYQAFISYKREVELENSSTPAPLPANRRTKISPIQNKTNTGSNNPMPQSKTDESSGYQSSSTNKKKKIDKRHFSVQIATSKQIMKSKTKKWNKVKFPVEIKKEKGIFKYLAGNFKTMNEATMACRELRKLGFKDAFVVAYIGEQRVKVSF